LPCQISIFGEEVIDVSLPDTVEYTVVETPPNYKGNSGSGTTKPATLDSGAVVQVPMFIEVGEKISISTQDVKYVGRASK
jgi:elongation factor P